MDERIRKIDKLIQKISIQAENILPKRRTAMWSRALAIEHKKYTTIKHNLRIAKKEEIWEEVERWFQEKKAQLKILKSTINDSYNIRQKERSQEQPKLLIVDSEIRVYFLQIFLSIHSSGCVR